MAAEGDGEDHLAGTSGLTQFNSCFRAFVCKCIHAFVIYQVLIITIFFCYLSIKNRVINKTFLTQIQLGGQNNPTRRMEASKGLFENTIQCTWIWFSSSVFTKNRILLLYYRRCSCKRRPWDFPKTFDGVTTFCWSFASLCF